MPKVPQGVAARRGILRELRSAAQRLLDRQPAGADHGAVMPPLPPSRAILYTVLRRVRRRLRRAYYRDRG
jgi:hypothetical protein